MGGLGEMVARRGGGRQFKILVIIKLTFLLYSIASHVVGNFLLRHRHCHCHCHCYRQHVNVDYYILIAVGATFVVLKVQYIVA